MAMKTSSTVDSNSSWTEPLLVPTSTIDREGQDESKQDQDGEKDSKFIKRSQQLHVHRLLSFLFGSMVGIGLQVASVVVFARLVQHAQLRYGDDIAANLRQAMENTVTATTTTSSEQTMARYEAILKSEDSTWFNMAIWVVYHASLSVYLIIWASMMTMAVSKVGWRCISSGLRIPSKVTRRTCFLRTFFFINGFVQGSLVPWVILEVFVGTSSFDVMWMPMIHLGVFLAVVFTYDWMKDESSNKCVEDTDREEDLNEETNFLV